MKRTILAVAAGAVMWSMTALAFEDITINDTLGIVKDNSWYDSRKENQEVELNMQIGQAWDMEKFLLDKAAYELKVQGGYNMKNGYNTYYSGDVFIDVDGIVTWGKDIVLDPNGDDNSFDTISNSYFKWDYVIAFDRKNSNVGGSALTDAGGYKVYSLSDASSVLEVWFDKNNQSNPLRYGGGGQQVASGTGLVQTPFSDSEGTHYVLGNIDLSFLAGKLGASDVTFHYTMGCGNDLLMGQTPSWQVPDGGLTLALLGGSLSALVLVSRRLRKA